VFFFINNANYTPNYFTDNNLLISNVFKLLDILQLRLSSYQFFYTKTTINSSSPFIPLHCLFNLCSLFFLEVANPKNVTYICSNISINPYVPIIFLKCLSLDNYIVLKDIVSNRCNFFSGNPLLIVRM
jgi:hypothetical protein